MESNKKYKLTNESIKFYGRKLYRIEALKTFSNVKKGDKGGFIERENNLSQYGDCWVYENAKVFKGAKVYDNARVSGNVKVFNNAKVFENANVYGNVEVYDDAKVYGFARVYDSVMIFGNAKVFGSADIYDRAMINNKSEVSGYAMVHGDAIIINNAKVYGDAAVYGNVVVHNKSEVYGNVNIGGEAQIYNGAKISSISDYIVFKNWWSSGRYFTWTRSNNMWEVGCFYGTGEELIDKAYKDSELSGREYEKAVKYVESILKDSETIEKKKQLNNDERKI